MAFKPLRHLGLKLLSVSLAALIWLLIPGGEIFERSLRIPLEYANLPAELEPVGDVPAEVDVRIRGSSGTLSRIGNGELVAVLDFRTARAGQRLFHLTADDVRAPFGVEVVQIAPASVPITFESSATKVVPVVPGLEGEPGEGYEIGAATADPATVEVVGPASAVARLTEAITEPVSVAGATSEVTETVTVGVTDPTVRLRVPASAVVTVSISTAPVEFSVAGVPVRVRGGESSPFEVVPEEVTVLVRGPRGAPAPGAADFEASVDVEGLAPGLFQLQVQVTPPAGVGIARVEPPVVRVRVRSVR